MKLLEKHHNLLLYVWLPMAVLSVLLVVFFSSYLPYSFYVNYLFLLLTIMLVLSPYGNIRLAQAEQKPRFSTLYSSLIIIAAEIGLLLMYWGIYTLTTQIFPVIPLSQNSTFVQIFSKQLLDWGLYPWPIYALVGINLAYIMYCRGDKGILSNLVKPLIKNTEASDLGITLNGFTRSCSNYCLASTLCFATLALVALVLLLWPAPLAAGLNTSMLAVTVVIYLVAQSKYWQRTVRNLSVKLTVKRYQPLLLAMLVSIFIAAIIVVMSHFTHALEALLPRYPFLQGFKHFIETHSQHYVLLLLAVWWLAWTVLMAAIIAYACKGRRIRTVLIQVLTLPILMAVILHFGKAAIATIIISPVWSLLSLLIGSTILFGILLQQKNMTYLIRNACPGAVALKPRAPYHYLHNLFKLAINLILVYLATGLFLTTVGGYVIAFIPGIVIALAGITLVHKKAG